VTRILVLGATGGTGRHVVDQALQQGHLVSVLARDPQRLAAVPSGLRIFTGDATSDGPALGAAMDDQDVVISALGRGKSFKSNALLAQSMQRVVRAMKVGGVRRLIVTSAFGVGDTYRDAPFLPRVFIRTLLRDVYRDKEAGEVHVRGSDLDWTLVYPTGLSDRPFTGRWRAGERLALRGFPLVSRADVAAFLLSQIDDTDYVRKGVLIGS
jgi:uncharacterized protein YbjT (DUF2867 family)